MPADLLGLDLWVPGGSGLALPDDVALEVPETARSIVIEAHALREETPPESGAMVRIGLANAVPPHVATWAKVEAPVPAIRPLMTERSTATCLFSEDFHVISVLPHMHRVGAEFHGTRIQGSTREPFLDVVPWNFDEQQSYPLDLDVTAGDRVEAECIWQNPTDAYVLPGMYTKNEMCTLGLLGYPSGAGDCTQE
jgi:hypothetical protein